MMCCAEVVVSIGGTGNPFCLLVPPLRGGLITFLLLISLPSMISMQKDCTTPPHCFTMNSASYRWPKLKTEKKINGDLMWITSYLTSQKLFYLHMAIWTIFFLLFFPSLLVYVTCRQPRQLSWKKN